MVPIAPQRPLLQHTIEHLKNQGITDFIINTHYLPDAIASYFGDGSQWDIRITYSDESEELMDTAGAIKKVEHLLDDNFLLVYGDMLTFLDVGPIIEQHFANDALATIAVKASDNPHDGDLAGFDLISQRIVKWYRRPHTIKAFAPGLCLNAGIYVLSKKITKYIPAGVPIKLDGEIIPGAIAAGEPLYAYLTHEPILDIGMPEKYEYAKKYYEERKRISVERRRHQYAVPYDRRR
jgi:NDP-sugar pyrophosphorylase family protein